MSQRLRELATLFLKLGIIGFGGPAAHIAMMEEETVGRRKWLTREHFLDLVGATNLIPGPNSTEMVMHVGYTRAGWRGLLVAGACFILPAMLITTAFAWAYVRFGSLPQVASFLHGVKPAVLAIILSAVWRLGKAVLKGWRLAVVGLAVVLASLLGVNEVIAIVAGGVIGMLWLRLSEGALRFGSLNDLIWLPWLAANAAGSGRGFLGFLAHLTADGSAPFSLWRMGAFFLKVGAVMYGSGYVLVAFLDGGLVHQYGWLTQQQLLDAIAVGQFTPGPLLSTAAFIGYVLGGGAGGGGRCGHGLPPLLLLRGCAQSLDSPSAPLAVDGGFPRCGQRQRGRLDGGGDGQTGAGNADRLACLAHRIGCGSVGAALEGQRRLAGLGRRRRGEDFIDLG